MKRTRRQHPRGFTLVEVMIALGVMLVGALGALTGLAAASRELREGQLRQYKMVLIDATSQRIRLQDKQVLISYATAAGTLPSTVTAISAAPWTLDATTLVPGDLGTGAYFKVLPNGQILQLDAATTPAVAANTACNAVPQGIYCREVLVRAGGPVASPGAIATGASLATVWIRVSRMGEPASMAVTSREVVVQ
jgi:prepilin-type N-terminal cleavage/methylation domain-containing protein